MPLSPHQVTNNANSKLIRLELALADRSRSVIDRMVDVVTIADAYRAEVGDHPASKLPRPTSRN